MQNLGGRHTEMVKGLQVDLGKAPTVSIILCESTYFMHLKKHSEERPITRLMGTKSGAKEKSQGTRNLRSSVLWANKKKRLPKLLRVFSPHV